jgi:hypothetical protein
MQLATQQIGAPFARPLNVKDMGYAYEVDSGNGMCEPTLWLIDIDDVSVLEAKPMGDAYMCVVGTGACVTSVAGGEVIGFDMYGQYVRETLAAGTPSKIAFAGIVTCPDDTKWVSQFGLPYKYRTAHPVPNAANTITASAADGDARGTFVTTADISEGAHVSVPYVADLTALFGAPYAERFKSGARVAPVTMVGTINVSGNITITKTLIADGSRNQFYTLPDGQQIRTANAAGPVNAKLSPLWMSKYARTITDVDTLVRGGTENGTSILVNLTGIVATPTSADDPDPVPLPGPTPFPTLPAAFTTHVQADAWLDEFTLALGVGEPLDWASQTLAQKYASAQALIDALD